MEGQTTQTVTLEVRDLACGGCAAAMERLLRQAEGVREARVSFDSGRAEVQYDPSRIDPPALVAFLTESGYSVNEPAG